MEWSLSMSTPRRKVMPELPEVRHCSEVLDKALRGKSVLGWNILPHTRYSGGFPGMELLKVPLKVEKVDFRGKRILFYLGNDLVLVSFLSMEGRWSWKPSKHSGMMLQLGTARPRMNVVQKVLYYNDSRKFGTLQVAKREDLDAILKNVGPDYFNTRPNIDEYMAAVKRKKTPISTFMMDQTLLSGIGNYLRSEILYKAQVKPSSKTSDLTRLEMETLLRCTYSTLEEAYRKRGLTLATYSDPDGNIGEYSPVVYGKKEDALGNVVETYLDGNKRRIHWVPAVQS